MLGGISESFASGNANSSSRFSVRYVISVKLCICHLSSTMSESNTVYVDLYHTVILACNF